MQYDITIIGGGMVGASVALALADTSLRIALIDAMPLQTKDDARLIALNYSSYCLFQNLNVWTELSANAEPIHEVHVSDRGHFGKTRIKKEDLALPMLGFVVPAKYINTALSNALSKRSNIKIFRPAILKNLTQDDTQVTLTIESNAEEFTLTTKQVIGADGSHSTVRQLLDISTETIDYQQSAIVTVTELQRAHQQIAYERFHQSGAIAMLPLTGYRCATIWTDDNKNIHELMALNDEQFLQTLQKQFGYRLGRFIKTATRHTYPLQMLKSTQTLKGRILLLGNAAHTLHPIAAQGLNLALAEIAMLAQSISEDAGWEKYLTWQAQKQSISMNLSHQLPRLFSQDFFLVTFLRQAGMVGLDICKPLKRYFTKKAIGRVGVLPKLLVERRLG